MNELLAFIRQLLPPNWRGAKTATLVQVLFCPLLTVWDELKRQRDILLGRASATGQVAVLEDLFTRTLGATVYILDGDRSAVDFQVVVPIGKLTGAQVVLAPLLDRYAQAGKRWRIGEAPAYLPELPNPGAPLAWTDGYPSRHDGSLNWAVTRTGTYHQRFIRNGVVLFEGDRDYVANLVQGYPDTQPTDTYTLEIGALSYTFPAGQAGVLELWVCRNGTDSLSILLDALPGGTYTWILDKLDVGGSVIATKSNTLVYSAAGNPRPGVSNALFRYGGLVFDWGNGSYRLRLSGGATYANPVGLYDSQFTISDGQPNYKLVQGTAPDTGTIESVLISDIISGQLRYGLVRATGTGAAGGVQARLISPSGTDSGWNGISAIETVYGGVTYTHLIYLDGYLSAAGTYTFSGRLTTQPAVQKSFSLTLGSGPTPPPDTPTPPASVRAVAMGRLRFRLRSNPDQVDIGLTANGSWEYQVARTPDVNGSQAVPNWTSIAWVDVPAGSSAAERVMTMAAHGADKTLQVRIRDKSNPTELYELPIKCTFGNAGGYDWLLFAEPASGLLDATQFTILPGRTWSEDLIITKEAGPDANNINVRFVSGFARQAGTRWFWWLAGCPLWDKADIDNFTVTLPKGQVFDICRYVCPDPFEYYKSETNVPEGTIYDTEPAIQMTANYYINGGRSGKTLIDQDNVRFWTGL